MRCQEAAVDARAQNPERRARAARLLDAPAVVAADGLRPSCSPANPASYADPVSTGPLAIRAQALSKTFRIPQERTHTLKERAIHPFRRSRFNELHVLKGVSFDVASGRVLRDRRTQRLRQEHAVEVPGRDLHDRRRERSRSPGRLSPFIELGVGFNPDLPARDNVEINAVMMGLDPRRPGSIRRDHRVR